MRGAAPDRSPNLATVPTKLIRNAYEAALTMTAVLLCWSAALLFETTAHLHTDVLVDVTVSVLGEHA